MTGNFQQTEESRDSVSDSSIAFPFDWIHPLQVVFFFFLSCLSLLLLPVKTFLQTSAGINFSHGLQNCYTQRPILLELFPPFHLVVSLLPWVCLQRQAKSSNMYRDNSFSSVLKLRFFKDNSRFFFFPPACSIYITRSCQG